MEIQTGENTLLLLMINSYLSFVSFTTKFFEFEIFPSPLSVEKVICAGNQNLLFHLHKGCVTFGRGLRGGVTTLPSLFLFAPTCLSRTLAYTTSRPRFSRLYTREPAYTCCSTRPPPSFHLRWVKSMEDDQWLSTLVVCLNLTGDRIIVVEASSPLLRSSS